MRTFGAFDIKAPPLASDLSIYILGAAGGGIVRRLSGPCGLVVAANRNM